MKFRRQLSEPQMIILDGCPPEAQGSWVANFWQRLVKGLSSKSFWDAALKLATGSAEPVITKYQDSHGHTVYSVYDPFTQQQQDGLSEENVHIWLEQRYR